MSTPPDPAVLYPDVAACGGLAAALRFSSTTRPSLTLGGPCLSAGGDGTYGVGTGFITPNLGVFATAAEAAALAVRHLPTDFGPVTLGRPLEP
ncbi:DUF6193 family natural product biosynthesis protein [Streptomyces sp. NPDC054958]